MRHQCFVTEKHLGLHWPFPHDPTVSSLAPTGPSAQPYSGHAAPPAELYTQGIDIITYLISQYTKNRQQYKSTLQTEDHVPQIRLPQADLPKVDQ